MQDDLVAEKRWYGARCVFRWRSPQPEDGGTSYEERIIVLRAVSFDHAIARAEEEAKTYAVETDADYLDFVTVYELPEDTLGDVTEVFSLLRDSDLTPKAYLNRHFDTGRERWMNR
jgi:hypothetical protein